ncbi:HypC/HybG/HupF family hydrogenase formation chaperone [Streptomyces niger]|uniref:HypC/HybG/HupF family hydrogenase formation chaperone n=1 Tax=Streptomyces niger TaxID=66373 RepID=UPI000699E14C|nr:HypC/HybG/HupF family hydrogenase formation chaperone [Streptomyces niger]
MSGRSGEEERSCSGEACTTCSDEAVAMRLVQLLPGDLALADAGGTLQEISVALVPAAVGATVLVHAGEAIARVPRTPALPGAADGEVAHE